MQSVQWPPSERGQELGDGRVLVIRVPDSAAGNVGQCFWQIKTSDCECLLLSRVVGISYVVVPDSATGKYIILKYTAPIVSKGIQNL